MPEEQTSSQICGWCKKPIPPTPTRGTYIYLALFDATTLLHDDCVREVWSLASAARDAAAAPVQGAQLSVVPDQAPALRLVSSR